MTDFGTLCQQMGGMLQRLEWDRQRRTGALGKWAGVLLLLATGVAVYGKVKEATWGWGVLAGLAALIVWAIAAAVYTGGFQRAFRAEVMPALVRAMGPHLGYHPGGCLDEEEFRACGLFRRPDRYSGSDLVEGTVGQTHLRFSLVHAEEEYEVTDTDSDGRTTSRTEYSDIFKGLLFSADCNKDFSGCTLVTTGGSGYYRGVKRVKLESPEFHRAFSVYGTDQVEARYLLSPSLMERILELRRRAGTSVQLSFVGSRLYLAMPMSLRTFDASLWKRIDDTQQLAGWYGTLAFIVGMVDDLNLNTRIWSKRPGMGLG